MGERHVVWWRIVALLLSAAVFSVDTFTDVHGAVAVFYVVVLLLLADGLTRRGLLLAGTIAVVLTVVSLAIAHGRQTDASAALRCATAIAAIVITVVLLRRSQLQKRLLISSNQALARSERRYRAIFDQASVSLWEQDYSRLRAHLSALRDAGVTDLHRHAAAHPGFFAECAGMIRTIDANDAAVRLLRAPDRTALLGPLSPFVEPEGPGFSAVLETVFRGERGIDGNGEMRRMDGEIVKVLFGIILPEEPHEFDRVVVSALDITQREAMQEALAATQTELARAARVATMGAVSASIAHELNQPLAAIVMRGQTCLRWLRRDPPDIAAATHSAERTVADAERASEIVKRIRAMLVEGERRDELVSLAPLVEETALLLEREFATHGARLRIELPTDLPPAYGDRVELQQILVNLVTNALNAMEGTPIGWRMVTIAATVGDGEVEVSVRDRGKGIAEDVRPRLFEPFFTTRIDGMGMGLAICRSLIEAHGGNLTAENHPEGGAVFRFTLLLEDAEAL